MSVKENKELARQCFNDLNEIGGDVANIRCWCEKYCAPSAIYHGLSEDTNFEQQIQNKSEYSVFLELIFIIDDIMAEGNKWYSDMQCNSAITKCLKEFLLPVEVFTMVQGKVVETWDYPYNLGAMTQLGALLSF